MTWQEYIDNCENMMRDCELVLPSDTFWQWCDAQGGVYLRLPLAQKEAPVYK
jgi:hypothetical protein